MVVTSVIFEHFEESFKVNVNKDMKEDEELRVVTKSEQYEEDGGTLIRRYTGYRI